MIPEARMKDFDRFSPGGPAPVALKPLMHPHQVKHPFMKIRIGSLLEQVRRLCGSAPLMVEICRNGHGDLGIIAVFLACY